MDTDISRMDAQLRNWLLKIDGLAGAVHGIGSPRVFTALVYIDELKALHATARSKLDEFHAADEAERLHLEGDLRIAWGELVAAIDNLGTCEAD
jgi:hypothetical protein